MALALVELACGGNFDAVDFGVEALSQIDVVSDFIYFFEILPSKDVNTAAKVFVGIFAALGVFIQYGASVFKSLSRTGKFSRCGLPLEKDRAGGLPSFTKPPIFGRELNPGDLLTEDEREFMKLGANITRKTAGLYEDLPQLILVLCIESARGQFGRAAMFSYWSGTLSFCFGLWTSHKTTARMTELRFKLDVKGEIDHGNFAVPELGPGNEGGVKNPVVEEEADFDPVDGNKQTGISGVNPMVGIELPPNISAQPKGDEDVQAKRTSLSEGQKESVAKTERTGRRFQACFVLIILTAVFIFLQPDSS